jgi:hypothetical protein
MMATEQRELLRFVKGSVKGCPYFFVFRKVKQKLAIVSGAYSCMEAINESRGKISVLKLFGES